MASITAPGIVSGLDVEDDQVAARIGEALRVGERVVDHQVAVERQVGRRPDCLDDDRAHGQVVDEVAVHHVEVDRVDAAVRRAAHLVAERG